MTLEELEPIVLELKEKIDTILSTAKDAEDKWNHDRDLGEFTERNKESLGKYVDKLKKLNGDDFDLYSAAFDEYKENFSDIEEATYVSQLVMEIENKINKLKDALGEDDVEIHSDDEGNLEVNTHDTEIETVSNDDEESKEDEEKEEIVEETETDEDEMSDEEKEFIKELEEEAEKYKRD